MFQRTFCPCHIVRRDIVIKNGGYLAEVGASIVDKMLELDIVPITGIAHLRSSSISKLGSLQKYVDGYINSTVGILSRL